MSKPTDKPQWVRVAEQFEHSGLTQKQFAQQQGVPLSTVQCIRPVSDVLEGIEDGPTPCSARRGSSKGHVSVEDGAERAQAAAATSRSGCHMELPRHRSCLGAMYRPRFPLCRKQQVEHSGPRPALHELKSMAMNALPEEVSRRRQPLLIGRLAREQPVFREVFGIGMPHEAPLSFQCPRHALVLLSFALIWSAAGCKNGEQQPPADAGVATTAESGPLPPEDAGSLWLPERPYPAKYHSVDLAGAEDYRNRYSAAVEVTTPKPMREGLNGWCSGVLISPQWVLTAGHCVCVRRPATTPGNEGKVIIDGSSCAQNPSVKVMIWDAAIGDRFIPSTGSMQSYTGAEVRPHPDFQILLDQSGRVESSQADLALILLETSVREPYMPLLIAEEDVQPGETFILVGGTADELQGNSFGARRFMRYKVLNFLTPGSDRVLFEQPKRELFRGDSGGPCVLEGSKGPRLVGISSRGLGTEPTFTSLHSYQNWLRAELRSTTPK